MITIIPCAHSHHCPHHVLGAAAAQHDGVEHLVEVDGEQPRAAQDDQLRVQKMFGSIINPLKFLFLICLLYKVFNSN